MVSYERYTDQPDSEAERRRGSGVEGAGNREPGFNGSRVYVLQGALEMDSGCTAVCVCSTPLTVHTNVVRDSKCYVRSPVTKEILTCQHTHSSKKPK